MTSKPAKGGACDHIVGHEYDGLDLGEVFYKVSNFTNENGPRPRFAFGSNAFKFCPECGTSLADFWKEHESLA